MKKVLVSAILGLAAIASVQAQSAIQLYSDGTASTILYGNLSGGTVGNAVGAGFTVGYYYALGDTTAAANVAIGGASTASGNNGSLASSGLTLVQNTGSTVGTEGSGEYYSLASSVVPTAPATGNPLVTIVLVAYNGATYETSGIRGHSAAFTMTANSAPTFALQTGAFANTFSVSIVPEPSTFALAGLGLASLLIFRRRK